MLEPIILDNTERLLTASGVMSNLSNNTSMILSQSLMTCYGRGPYSTANPYGYLNYLAGQGGAASFRSDINGILLMPAPSYGLMAINLATNAITLDFSPAYFNQIVEDSSGVIWAACCVSGYYGLWKRTGAGAWTKVLSDTGACYVGKYTDGNCYFASSSANWYVLAGGAATITTASAAGGGGWQNYGLLGDPSVLLGYGYAATTGFGALPLTPGTYASEGGSARYWPTVAASSSAAPLGNIPWEHLCETTQWNVPVTTTNPSGWSVMTSQTNTLYSLSSTYTLHATKCSRDYLAADRFQDSGFAKVVLSILNKTTGVSKYIGSITLTSASTVGSSATVAAQGLGGVIGARLTGGVLDLWLSIGAYTTSGSPTTDVYGLFKKSLTISLDF